MKLKHTIMALAAMAGSASAATTIAFNFTEAWHAKTVQGEGSLFGTDQWTDSINVATATNGDVAANSTDLHAVTTPVGAAGVTVSWNSNNMFQAGDEGGALENQMFRRYLDDTTGITISLGGLSSWLAAEGATTYTVTFFQNSDVAANTFNEINLYDGIGTGGTLLENMADQLSDGSGNGDGSRLIRSTTNAFSADSITFSSNRDGAQRAGVSGFIITTVPEPSSTALLGLGGLALILRRRK